LTKKYLQALRRKRFKVAGNFYAVKLGRKHPSVKRAILIDDFEKIIEIQK